MRTSKIVGRATRLPSAIFFLSCSPRLYACGPRTRRYRGNVPPHSPFRALRSTLYAFIAFSTLGCNTPRVIEVSSRTRLQDIDAADKNLFVPDAASRLRYNPRDLPADAQRQEFYICWTPSTVGLMKFEYRQVNKPNAILEQTYMPHGDRAKLFEVRGEGFRAGGPVSAWCVSLWNGDQLLAEKKSALW